MEMPKNAKRLLTTNSLFMDTELGDSGDALMEAGASTCPTILSGSAAGSGDRCQGDDDERGEGD